ncbi:MAG: 3D domain-containing protein [Bacillota bacterium]
MTGYEASDNIWTQRNTRCYKLRQNKKRSNIWALTSMFFIVMTLCANNFILLDSYNDMKADLALAQKTLDEERTAKNQIKKEESDLKYKCQKLEEELANIKKEYNAISMGNNDLSQQLEKLRKHNDELSKQVKELTEDNIALQNTLKMAASVGIKPQSYNIFKGLEPRDNIYRGQYAGKFLGTAYTPSKEECGNDKGITKSGAPIIPGVSIAIDNRYWPFGTVFYIKGLGYTVAMDTGSAVKGKYRFDFSVLDKEFALKLGSRKWDVYLVKLGDGKVNDIKL